MLDHLNALIPFGAIGAALNGTAALTATAVATATATATVTPLSVSLPVALEPLLEQDSMTSRALGWLINGFVLLLQTILPITGMRSVTNMVSDVIEKSRDSGSTLEVLDVCLLFVGYFSIFSSIFLIFLLSQAMEKIAGFSKFVSALSDVIRSLAGVSKVFVLLYLRIFILPMCLGACVLSSANVLLVIPREEWVTFIATNIVGSIALTWVLGITYMLTVTLFVLQLREVLHPGVLAQNIRPQEAHLDLLGSLILDTSVNHVRRMCVLMVVYMVLMALLVVAPIWLVRFTSRMFNTTHYLTLRTWYVLPEVQLPFELAFGHIAFLT